MASSILPRFAREDATSRLGLATLALDTPSPID